MSFAPIYERQGHLCSQSPVQEGGRETRDNQLVKSEDNIYVKEVFKERKILI